MTESRQQGGAFAAVLGAVIDDVREAVPEYAMARFAFCLVADGAEQILVAKAIEKVPQCLPFILPARAMPATSGKSSGCSSSMNTPSLSKLSQAYSASIRWTSAPRKLPQPRSLGLVSCSCETFVGGIKNAVVGPVVVVK